MKNSYKTRLNRGLGAALLVTLFAGGLAAQRPTAITNARVLTMAGNAIEQCTIVIRNGKIAEIGTGVIVPGGALVVDAKGGTVMPGLVSAYSRAGMSGGRPATPQRGRGQRRRGRGNRGQRGAAPTGSMGNNAATKVVDGLYARQDVFRDLLDAGITSLAVAPTGAGFPGQGALLDLTGTDHASLVVDDNAFIAINPANNTRTKTLVKEAFTLAAEVVEERKNPASGSTTEEETDDRRQQAQRTQQQRRGRGRRGGGRRGARGGGGRGQAPQLRKDENTDALADLLEGKKRGLIALGSATDALHYLDAVGETRFTATILAQRITPNQGTFDLVLDELRSLSAAVLMAPQLSQRPNTNQITNPAGDLIGAGFEVGFIIGDSKPAVTGLFGSLIELVRHGLDADAALRAVTIVPAKILGIADQVGSIETGKAANLLLWSTDPLNPTAKLVQVWHEGVDVKEIPKR